MLGNLNQFAEYQVGGERVRHFCCAPTLRRLVNHSFSQNSECEVGHEGLDITAWLQWFLKTLLNSLEQALARIDRVLVKARFWQAHRSQTLSAEQIKVLNRLLDGGERGFENGISAAQYQAVAKVSKATATRHLSDLLEKGCIERLPGGGHSTRYQIARCTAL